MADYGEKGIWCLSKENGNHGWDRGCDGRSPVDHPASCCAHFEGITVNATSLTAPWHELVSTKGTEEEHARAKALGGLWQAGYSRGMQDGKKVERQIMLDMRKDYQSMPHAQFPEKWPNWRDYADVLPTYCSCPDCRLWRSGS